MSKYERNRKKITDFCLFSMVQQCPECVSSPKTQQQLPARQYIEWLFSLKTPLSTLSRQHKIRTYELFLWQEPMKNQQKPSRVSGRIK